jgi:hypothetical protein
VQSELSPADWEAIIVDMPAKSAKQQHLMGAALAAKRGAKTFPEAQKVAGQMSEKQLEDFARKPKTYLPKK